MNASDMIKYSNRKWSENVLGPLDGSDWDLFVNEGQKKCYEGVLTLFSVLRLGESRKYPYVFITLDQV